MTWFIVRTATRQEQRALASLTEADFTCYLPSETRWSQGRGPKEKVQRPLYAGYLFVDCDPTPDAWVAVRDLEGIHQFVQYLRRDGELEPMPIPAGEVERIRNLELAGHFDVTRPSRREQKRLERKAKAMRKGEAVQLTDGPFSGFIGRVLEMRQSERAALVGVEAFGRIVQIELDVDHLDAA